MILSLVYSLRSIFCTENKLYFYLQILSDITCQAPTQIEDINYGRVRVKIIVSDPADHQHQNQHQ